MLAGWTADSSLASYYLLRIYQRTAKQAMDSAEIATQESMIPQTMPYRAHGPRQDDQPAMTLARHSRHEKP